LLSGCAGTSFSPGINKDAQLYKFFNWKEFMNTKGMNEAMYCFRLFESRAWYDLIPELNQASTITNGRGTYGDIDYVCYAQTFQKSTLIAYVPTSRTITVNLAHISGSSVNAWWYDPENGKSTLIGSFQTKYKQEFTSTKGDQILVIDDASLNLSAPGIIISQ
jgi:hypothetical protein